MLSVEPAREFDAARLIRRFMEGPELRLEAAAATAATLTAAEPASSVPAGVSQRHPGEV
jgi:hypothetical protein